MIHASKKNKLTSNISEINLSSTVKLHNFMQYCPACGEENPADSQFCMNCGSALIKSQTQSSTRQKYDRQIRDGYPPDRDYRSGYQYARPRGEENVHPVAYMCLLFSICRFCHLVNCQRSKPPIIKYYIDTFRMQSIRKLKDQ